MKNKTLATMHGSTVYYVECPHCDNIIIYSDYDQIEALKKWKKQKPIKKK